MDVDSRHLRALVAVVEQGTFTDAAIELGVTQASVSRSVQRLESQLGVQLLVRNSRYVAPTPAGNEALVHARQLLATLEQLSAVGTGSGARLRVGYAWSALGEHTVGVQRAWRAAGYGELELVQSNTPTAGLLEGRCEAAVLRRAVDHPRLASVQLGQERRYAALATDHRLAGQETVRLDDFDHETVAVDAQTGTTGKELWPNGTTSPAFLLTHGTDDWLTLIAAGRAVGMSSEATAAQHPRPGVVYVPVADAPPIVVWLAWWKDSPPRRLRTLIEVASAAYRSLT
jgi:DNA-binding transcriptional LysR family regulator